MDIEQGRLPAEFVDSAQRMLKLAEETLEEVMRDKRAPAPARVSAANSVLDRQERAAERAQRSAAEKEINELTPAELASIIRRLELQRAAAAAEDAQVIEHKAP